MRVLDALGVYTRVLAEQVGWRQVPVDPQEAALLLHARADVEDLLGWQVMMICAGWAIGALLTATGLGLIQILDRPEWRIYTVAPALMSALGATALMVAGFAHLPAKLRGYPKEGPPPRNLACWDDTLPLATPPAPPATAATVVCLRRRRAASEGERESESRLILPTAGPATERMRFTAHPGRPGHDGATRGIDPSWPYVA